MERLRIERFINTLDGEGWNVSDGKAHKIINGLLVQLSWVVGKREKLLLLLDKDIEISFQSQSITLHGGVRCALHEKVQNLLKNILGNEQ